MREGVERWVEEEEKEENAMLEYRRRANNKIGFAEKMKDRNRRWAGRGGEAKIIEVIVSGCGSCGEAFMQKGSRGCRRYWPYLTLGRTFESAVCNFTRGVAGGFLKTPFGFFIVR